MKIIDIPTITDKSGDDLETNQKTLESNRDYIGPPTLRDINPIVEPVRNARKKKKETNKKKSIFQRIKKNIVIDTIQEAD